MTEHAGRGRKMSKLVCFILGSGFWVFLYWLSGAEFPTERGADLLFFTVFLLGFGGFGVVAHWMASYNQHEDSDQ